MPSKLVVRRGHRAAMIVGLGALFILIGWIGISGEALVAKQLPYLISGGIGGLALVGLGSMLVGTEDLKRTQERIDHLDDLVADLHNVLLSRPDAPVLPANGDSGTHAATAPPSRWAAGAGAASDARGAPGGLCGGFHIGWHHVVRR